MTGCMGTGTITRTWKATDQCGASATCIQSIVVEDNTSPTNLITITHTDHLENLGQCNGTGSFTRHWTATDMCGNVAACIQTIVIIDNTAPVLNLPPSLTISCEQSTSTSFTGQAEAFDNCTPVNQLVITFSDNVLGLTG